MRVKLFLILSLALLVSQHGHAKESALIETWPQKVSDCSAYQSGDSMCRYLLCLCYVNMSPPNGQVAEPNENNLKLCNDQFKTCSADKHKKN